jgi:dodecin
MTNHVYKQIELTGTSTTSMEDAVRTAITKASKSLHGLHWFQVVDTRGLIDKNAVAQWQVTVKVGFTLDD